MSIQSSTSLRASWVLRTERLHRSRTALGIAVLTCLLAAGCETTPVAADSQLSGESQLLATVRLRIDPATGTISTVTIPEPGTRGIAASQNLKKYLRQERVECAICNNETAGLHTIIVRLRAHDPEVKISGVTVHDAYCSQFGADCPLGTVSTIPSPPPTLFYNYPFDVKLEAHPSYNGDFEVWFQVSGVVLPDA